MTPPIRVVQLPLPALLQWQERDCSDQPEKLLQHQHAVQCLPALPLLQGQDFAGRPETPGPREVYLSTRRIRLSLHR